MSHLQTENSELKKSLEFAYAEVSELKQNYERLNRDFNALKNGATDEELPDRVRILEDHARSNNIRISGIKPVPNETPEQTVKFAQDLIKDKLKLNDVKVLSAFRSKGHAGEEKQVIANLLCSSDKLKCLKAKKNLRGTDVFINEDVCKKTLEIRKSKLPELKKLRDDGLIAYFSGTRIITRIRSNNAKRNNDSMVPRSGLEIPNGGPAHSGLEVTNGAALTIGSTPETSFEGASAPRQTGSGGPKPKVTADSKAVAAGTLKTTAASAPLKVSEVVKKAAPKQPYGTRSKKIS